MYAISYFGQSQNLKVLPLFFDFRKHFSYSLQHTKALVANNKFHAIQTTTIERN